MSGVVGCAAKKAVNESFDDGIDFGSSGAFEAEFEQRECDVSFCSEPAHDVAQIRGEQRAIGGFSRKALEILGCRRKPFANAVYEPLGQRIAAAKVVRRGSEWHLHGLIDGAMGEAPRSFTGKNVRSDVLERVRALKAEQGKDLWLVGGGTLAHSLLPELDRLVLKQNRSIIESGIPLFSVPFHPQLFRPVDETLLDSGKRVLTYGRA